MDSVSVGESLSAGARYVCRFSESLTVHETLSNPGVGRRNYREVLTETLTLSEATSALATIRVWGEATSTQQVLQACSNEVTTLSNSVLTVSNDVTSLSHTSAWCWNDTTSTQSIVVRVGNDSTSTQLCGTIIPVVSSGGAGPIIGPTQLRTMTKPWANLSGAPVLNFRVSQMANRGWDWSATVAGRITFPVDPAAGEQEVFVLHVGDGRGHTLTSPPLVASSQRAWDYSIGGEVTIYSGTDQTSWKLSQPFQSLPTLRNTQFSTIIKAIAEATGVTIYGPTADLNLTEEDIKQSNWWDALARMAEVAICNLVVDPSGALRFVPLQWVGETCNFVPEKATRSQNPTRRVTGFLINKLTSHYQAAAVTQDRYYTFDSAGYKVQQLRHPVSSAVAVDESTSGSCSLVGFWDGNPNTPTSNLIRFQSMGNADQAFVTVPATNKWPATWITVAVAESAPPFDTRPIAARLAISGSSPPPEGAQLQGVDLSFTVTVGVIKGQGARPGPVRNESLYPSKAYVIANSQGLLWESNKDFDTIRTDGPIDCTARLFGKLKMALPATVPPARIQQVDHTGSDSGFSTALNGFVIPW